MTSYKKKSIPSILETLQYYNDVLNTPKNRVDIEFEVRFDQKNITAHAFRRAFSELSARGFQIKKSWYSLRPSFQADKGDQVNSYQNTKTRIEIDDLISIQALCRHSSKLPENIAIVRKQYAYVKKKGDQKCSFKNMDYNFHTSIQLEELIDEKSIEGRDIKTKWPSLLKTFRYINRTSLVHESFPNIRIDLSKVKMNQTPHEDFSRSGVLDSTESFEIEIEIVNIKKRFDKITQLSLEKQLKRCIMFVLVSLQGTPYPVEYRRINGINIQYMKLLKFKPDKNQKYRKNGKNFIGPSSVTLQPINLVNDPTLTESNICIQRDQYCVTDKADGDRKLLYISKDDMRLYFISPNLDITFSGLLINKDNISFANTLIDGELITKDKYGRNIALFAAFDIYFLRGKDKRLLPFKSSKDIGEIDRHSLLVETMSNLSKCVTFVMNQNKSNLSADNLHEDQLQLTTKRFYFSTPTDKNSLFNSNRRCFQSLKEHQYNTDGFIFTPMNLGVTQEKPNDIPKDTKYTWSHSFKWKPPEYNTIDFLISVKKDVKNYIKEKIVNGVIVKYCEVILKVGVNKNSHGLTGSQQRILDENLKYSTTGTDMNKDYTAEPFHPTSPFDPNAHLCHLILHSSEGGLKIFTEENDLVEDDTIVEFRYDTSAVDKMNAWIPIRVRDDKTAEYLNSKKTKGFGNAYHVANSNWQSIHQPVTKGMLVNDEVTTLDNILISDKYYNTEKNNRRSASQTFNLRLFHNTIKERLIKYAASKQTKTTLLDLAVGKGGDLYKWIKSDITAVLGIDVSKDNIHNPHDGACKRYIELFANKKQRVGTGLIAMFIAGDTSKNIENGDFDDKEAGESRSTYIARCLMGSPEISENNIQEKFLKKHYGIFEKKFDICSIQFAVHYMFENEKKLHNFIKNVSDSTHIGSYFIGTCYDGKRVYEALKSGGGSAELYKNKKKIWGINKNYDDDEDDTFLQGTRDSLGYKISVYQESINQEIEEYLVNFEYFEKVMEDYGFKRDVEFHIQDRALNPIGNFKELYEINNSESVVKKKDSLSKEEETISFLNNYFVFKKMRDIVIDPAISIENELTNNILINRAKKTNRTILLRSKLTN